MKEIETSKGRFLICDDGCDEFEALLYFFRCYKLSEITEEELYNETEITYSMLHFKGIEITQNTYIFKV